MPITINGNNVNVVIFNNTQVDAVTVNGNQVFPDGPQPSEFDITLTSADLEIALYYTQSSASAVSIDWGDGSVTETSSDTSVMSMWHTYAAAGDYTISMTCANGETWSPGIADAGDYIPMFGDDPAACTAIRMGDGMRLDIRKAFNANVSLAAVTFNGEVTSIANTEFNACALVSVTIPDSVMSIGNTAFSNNQSMVSADIGSGVTDIGTMAFSNSTNTTLTVRATTPPTLGSTAYGPNLTAIYVPAASVDAYKAANRWSTYASIIQAIPE